jgi:hypothetical protein
MVTCQVWQSLPETTPSPIAAVSDGIEWRRGDHAETTVIVNVEFPDLGIPTLSVEIDRKTTVNDLTPEILAEVSQVETFVLSCQHRELGQKELIISVNPDLEFPLIGRVMRLKQSDPPLFHFRLFSRLGGFVIGGQSPKISDAKAQIHTIFGADLDAIEISVEGKLKKDNERIDFQLIYSVEITKMPLSLTLHFMPFEEVDCNQRLVWTIKTDVKLHKTVGELLEFLRGLPSLNPNLNLSLFTGNHSLPPELSLIHLNSEKNLSIRYPVPSNPSSQRFIREGQSGRPIVLQINRDQTVRDVKYSLLSEIGQLDTLASVLLLHLFDCRFADKDLFSAYGIPENSVITFFELSTAVSVIEVHCGVTIEKFHFTASDTIQELTFALQRHRGKESRSFTLQNDTGFLIDGELLSVVATNPITLVELFQFRSKDESVFLPMREYATLRDAAVALAEHFKIPQEQIQFEMCDSVIDDLSTQIWSYGDSIEFSHRKHLQTFVLDGQQLDLLIDFDIPLCDILSLLSLKFNISAPISIFFNDAEVDLEMTLADLESTAPLEIRLSIPDTVMSAPPSVTSPPASSIASYSIMLLLGIIPRIGTYRLAPTATLEEAETSLKRQLNQGDLELEFGLFDMRSDETTIIPKSTVIGELDLEKFSLIARPSETFESPAGSVSVNESGNRSTSGNSADVGGRLLTVRATFSTSKVYDFFCDSLQQNLHIRLPPETTVKQAKEAVACQCNTVPEAVFLHFLGKELQDNFMMDRLRLGTAKINISFRNKSETSSLTKVRLPSECLRDFSQLKVIRVLKNSPSSVVKLVRDGDMKCEIVVRWQMPPIGEESLFASKFVDQTSLLVKCSHPCLLKFFGWSFPTESSPGQIGMEYAPNGSLRDLFCRQQEIDDTKVAIIICGIVQGMKYLNEQGIIHRDLRPENIFLDCFGSPKIGGFEKARLSSVDLTLTSGDNCSLYLAPELYKTENVEELTPAVDVYSFGLILYELIVGQPVFPRDTPLGKLHSLAAGTSRPKLPPEMSSGVKQIIQQSWSADPIIRNSFEIIWRQLEVLNFKITPKVEVESVMNYIQQITRV